MALLEISVVPVGTGSSSFSSSVADIVKLLQEKGIKYQVTPTATILEGDIDQLLDVAKAIHQHTLMNGANRVITNMMIDERTDKSMEMEQQVTSVTQLQ
jgi:uncharacterized protein (TIGR00106 family)